MVITNTVYLIDSAFVCRFIYIVPVIIIKSAGTIMDHLVGKAWTTVTYLSIPAAVKTLYNDVDGFVVMLTDYRHVYIDEVTSIERFKVSMQILSRSFSLQQLNRYIESDMRFFDTVASIVRGETAILSCDVHSEMSADDTEWLIRFRDTHSDITINWEFRGRQCPESTVNNSNVIITQHLAIRSCDHTVGACGSVSNGARKSN